jgi:hypothetical protein
LAEKKYTISKGIFYFAAIIIVAGIIALIYSGTTLEDTYKQIDFVLNDKRTYFIGSLILIVLAIVHALLTSLRRNIDVFDKKSVIDLGTWFGSIFFAIGTGFIICSSLKVFNSLLGEKVAGVQFLLHPEDGFISWPFMVITLLTVVYCIIRIGIMTSEVVSLCKGFIQEKE